MASTQVLIIVKNATYDSKKILTETETEQLLGQVHGALADNAPNLTYTSIMPHIRRDDDTPGT
jgi:hypothetical protein